MARIMNPTTNTEVAEAAVLKAYFGFKPDQTLKDFMDEVRALSPESKTELALGAAKELGWTVVQ